MADVLEIIESAYDLGASDAEWLRGMLVAARPFLDRGLGMVGWGYDLAAPNMLSIAPVGVGNTNERHLQLPLEQAEFYRDDEARRAYVTASPFSTGSEILDPTGEAGRMDDFDASTGGAARDFLALRSATPDGRGVLIGAPLSERVRADPKLRGTMERVAAHIAAVYRLRTALAASERSLPDEPRAAAVFDADHRVSEARGEAKRASVREVLRAAAVAVDRARGPLRRRDPEQAVALWRALVAGRYSLVEHFDHDGKRFVIAMENEISLDNPRALKERERQVATLASMGHGNKLIAYTLGLGPSTVATHLRVALRKLGLAKRSDLIALNPLFGPPR